MNVEHLTVSELNRYIKNVVQSGFPQPLWVCGEIQQFNRNRNKKHIFFELVEKDGSSQDVKSRIGLVIFGGTKSQIDLILKKSENAFELKDDIEVKFLCRIDYYAPHGAMRLIVESIDPTYTLGKLAQEKQKLIALLKKQGTLDKNKKLTLPRVPLRLGVITAHDSAAYNDFCSEIENSGFAFKVFVRNTLMQGKNAEADIVKALDDCLKILDLDVLVITRGGGSLADLSCFDSKLIAEKIANSPLPVLTGIGHEINLSIADMAAHTYEKTPTAIAQYLVGSVSDFIDTIDTVSFDLVRLLEDKIADKRQWLRNQALLLQQGTLKFLKDHHARITRFKEKAGRGSLVALKQQKSKLLQEKETLSKNINIFFNQQKMQLKHVEKIVEVVHPDNTFKRGFSVTRDIKGQVIKGVGQVLVGSDLVTEFVDGKIISKVKESKREA